ncbi:hypothetical protein [Mycobacteroides abscessus]|uniref:hypothetical protein n=1 Tax=Mycobacteroides abscessus TaxID=36809 RepID=UPI000929CCF1|nr:hypothetical protein [Mycobacteroides abscessus]SKS05161.1 Uncharacterised protein [Mycobacteroides abscessus subsp. abscessus]SHU53969.1 Uncharacterised protein [Mycobacteroides abscessus subsp. bolletii]SHW62647.1 Uncharacterised protein [Mycobacteroides abscessus subsp. bolletii]SHW90661.1 Uncharacterised protein [Mycobacteroides abscessus subsp. bolletii]SHX34774.1 Uncharacterised protein [Mycobacteroides abscessus subsp. bolletii]
MADPVVKWNKRAINQLVKTVVEVDGVPRMKRVAKACNDEARITDGYRVSVEGDEKLTKADYRATVITATTQAMRNNAKHNTLVRNLPKAGG